MNKKLDKNAEFFSKFDSYFVDSFEERKERKCQWWFNKQAKRKKYLERIKPSFRERHYYWYSRFEGQRERFKGEYIFSVTCNFRLKEIKVGFRHLNGKERFITERFTR